MSGREMKKATKETDVIPVCMHGLATGKWSPMVTATMRALS